MQPDKMFWGLEYNLVILRRFDGIAATRTTAPASAILSLYLEQILVLLLVVGDGELLVDCFCSHDSFWKFQ